MSALDFLSLGAAEPSDRFRPLARSSMERRLREAGAEFEERDGWLVATRVPGEEEHGLAVRDVTHLYAVRESAEGTVVVFGDGVRGRRPPAGGGDVVLRYRHGAGADASPADALLVDVSAGYAALELDGPGATTTLRRLTELDLDRLPAVGAVAHVRAWIVPRGREWYVLLFEQEHGHYVWEVVVDAAEPLGGAPAGSGAIAGGDRS